MAARKRRAAPADADEAEVRTEVAVHAPPRMILRCHRERDQVQDIETTLAELREGVDVPLYTLRVQIV